MDKQFKETCLVQLGEYNSSKSDSKPDMENDQIEAASGLVISAGQGFVITHGSLLVSFLSKNKAVSNRLENNGHVPSKVFQRLQVRVILDAQVVPKNTQKTPTVKSYARSLLTSSSVLDAKQKHVKGSIEVVWKAEKFARTIKSFLPKDDWSFFEDPSKDTKSEKKNCQNDDIDADMVARLLPCFILIKLHDWDNRISPSTYTISDGDIRLGETIHMVGTPFGSMAPSVFLNSVSQGVVCNTAGRCKELLVTDARCIPGTEGGPIFQGPATDRRCLLGLIVAALCWKANEWIGMSLACSIGEILQSMNSVIQLPEINSCFKKTYSKYSAMSLAPQPLPESCKSSAVLVKNGGSWGSGVLIDQGAGLVLTCGHVISTKQAGVKVRVDHPSINWYDADILYATPVNQTFDIGVVKLRDFEPSEKGAQQITIAQTVNEGESCYVVGHALFPGHHNLQPSVTSGVIAKVIRSQGKPVLLQSTCTVNAGASGGPLLSNSGKLLGVVACNAKDTVSGASYPNINLSVPMEMIWPSVEQYMKTSDLSSLSRLHVEHEEIAALWKLKEFNSTFHNLQSKL